MYSHKATTSELQVLKGATKEGVRHEWWYCPLSSSVSAIYMCLQREHITITSILPIPERATDKREGKEWRNCPLSFFVFAHLFTIEN